MELGVVVLLLAFVAGIGLVLLAKAAAARIEKAANTVRADAEHARSVAAELTELAAAERREATKAQASAESALAAAEADRAEAAQLVAEAAAELRRITGLDPEQATADAKASIIEAARRQAAADVHRAEAKARTEAKDRARRVLATAIQRLSGDTTAQLVVTRVDLPSEEMKGRLIGREGRNIRTFEAVTGVNLIIDESPDSVMLSCFDAERREAATVALAALMSDGRIHPGRIEQAWEEAVAGAPGRTTAAGHEAADRAGVKDLHPDLIEALGKLRLRTSYGQNVLAHLVECAHVAAAIAAEIGADVDIARRAALLHDIGKVISAETPGTHAALGAELAARAGESEVVVNAIAAHHDEVPMESVEAVIVQTADTCSAARPGARREELDQYVERLERLEDIVTDHAGVKRALAMSAGREVRVIVEPDEVDDTAVPTLAEAIAHRVENDLSYPGEIKVIVVRELRAEATAK